MSDHASTVLTLPLSVVESNLWDVALWPAFLGDVAWAERSAHERYLFGVRQGRRVFEVPAAVRWQAWDHLVVWRELSGPAWRGQMRLTAVNGRRTRLEIRVSAAPRSLAGRVSEMIGGRRRDLDVDLLRLADRLATIPQPFNPVRLAPRRTVGATAPVPPRPARENDPADVLTRARG